MSSSAESSFSLIPLDELLSLLIQRVIALLGSERCTIFLHDEATAELFSLVASGAEVKEIRIPRNAGLAGECFRTGRLINIPDAYADPRFNRNTDLSTGYRTRTILCFPIIGPKGEQVGVIQVLNKIGGQFTTAITLQNALAEAALEAARVKERQMTAQLAENHDKLQTAFRDLGAQKEKLETLMQRQRTMRRMAGAAGILVALIVAGVLIAPGHRVDTAAFETVTTQAITASVMVAGILEPISTSNLTCAFPGKIKTVYVAAGDRVKTGQLLIELDSTQIDSELRTLESHVIQARREVASLAAWNTSRDVASARRSVSLSRSELDQARVQAANTAKLFDRGVVSAIERTATVARVASLEARLASAEEELTATLMQGDEDHLRIAQNSLQNLEVELARKQANRARAQLIAPHDGVILRGDNTEAPLTVGRDIYEAEVLLRVGSRQGYAVRSSVDETDVLLVRLGQPVAVTGTAFPGVELQGEVSLVNSQGIDGGSGIASFEVAAAIPHVPEEVRSRLFLGMTTDVSIQVYTNENALVVPLGALQGASGIYTATVYLPDGSTAEREVTTGVTDQDVIEVLSGLDQGERVVLYR
jgi:HlyD family secretion protein